MACSYRPSCIDLSVEIVDCQMKVCELRLHYVYQGDYVAMHDVDIDRAELKICRDCFDKLWMGGNPDKSKKVQPSTVYRTGK